LGGCPGIFDRETRRILQYKLDAMLDEHLKYMKLQIGALLDRNISIIIITPMPVLGSLPGVILTIIMSLFGKTTIAANLTSAWNSWCKPSGD